MSEYVLPGYRFYVTLDAADAFVPPEMLDTAMEWAPGAFQTASGLGGELEVLSYAEGGRNDFVHQLPVRHSWGRITLGRGIARNPALWEWYQAGLHGSLGARRDGAIFLQTADGSPAMVWSFQAGLAARWNGPELHAEQSSPAIESLEIAHEGLSVRLASNGGRA